MAFSRGLRMTFWNFVLGERERREGEREEREREERERERENRETNILIHIFPGHSKVEHKDLPLLVDLGAANAKIARFHVTKYRKFWFRKTNEGLWIRTWDSGLEGSHTIHYTIWK